MDADTRIHYTHQVSRHVHIPIPRDLRPVAAIQGRPCPKNYPVQRRQLSRRKTPWGQPRTPIWSSQYLRHLRYCWS